MEINNRLKQAFLEWLTPDGVQYLKDIKKKHGRLDAVFNNNGIPYSVHFNEGMQIRNFMRDQPEFTCYKFNAHWLDDHWVEFTEKVIEDAD